jgi:GxxExxY protein
MATLKYEEESYRIRGAVYEVNREIGCGFLEAVYQECLAREFALGEIPFTARRELSLFYKGEALAQTYRPDFVCYGLIVVEIKAVADLTNEHRAQVHNYLHATKLELGLLVNFGHHPKAQVVRIVR